ncbi:MAG: hypothetical protein ACTJFV_10470 [Moraxellaceae bacterium]
MSTADAELLNIDRRIEWQADALVGLKFDVSSDKDLVVRFDILPPLSTSSSVGF